MKIKRILIITFALTLVSVCFAQQIKLDQKVSRRESREQLTSDSDDYRKNISRAKTFTLTVSATTKTEVFAILFTMAGGEISCDVAEGEVLPSKNFVYETSASAASEKVNIAFKKYGWGDDYTRKYGNDKVEIVAYVFNKRTGKFIGSKATSNAFAGRIQKTLKDEISKIVKSKVQR